MARYEQDREDLLAEATALVERVELRVARDEETVIVGFRHDGCASFYFGAEPALHFNTARQLRRAYAGGRLYKAEDGRLVALTRTRSDNEVALVREELGDYDAQRFLVHAGRRLTGLLGALQSGEAQVVGQVSAGAPVSERVARWLAESSFPLNVASSPHAR